MLFDVLEVALELFRLVFTGSCAFGSGYVLMRPALLVYGLSWFLLGVLCVLLIVLLGRKIRK